MWTSPPPTEQPSFDAAKHWLHQRDACSYVRLMFEPVTTVSILAGTEAFTTLRLLDLSGCSDVIALPADIQELTSLQYLNLDGCSLQALPVRFGGLVGLRHLILSHCPALTHLPDSFGYLSDLEALDVRACSGLQALPASFGRLQSLRRLDLRQCRQLRQLPSSMSGLSSLQQLRAGPSVSFTQPQMHSNVDGSNAGGSSRSRGPPQDLESLHGLAARWANRFRGSAPDVETFEDVFCKLSSLTHLDLTGNLHLLRIDLTMLTRLRRLVLRGCRRMTDLEGLCELQSLQHLDIREVSLQSLPRELGQLTALTRLEAASCRGLQQLPHDFGQLRSLQVVNLDTCRELRCLPDSITCLTSLQLLILHECVNLCQLPRSIGQLASLVLLDLRNCANLRHLPDSSWLLSGEVRGDGFVRRKRGRFCLMTRPWPIPYWGRMATVEEVRASWQDVRTLMAPSDAVQLADGYCSGSSRGSHVVAEAPPPLSLGYKLILRWLDP